VTRIGKNRPICIACMFIGGTYTVQFDNVLKSKHGLSVQNKELTSVSRFQEKEKRGEMITINDNIK
jgi:hypothetical protein